MLKSTFLSMGLHTFLILAAYFGLPSFKTNEIIEQPIDIVEDTPISSKTSLKLGMKTVKKVKKNIENPVIKKKPPPPPPLPSKKSIEIKDNKLKKLKEIKEIAKLVKKKPELKKKINIPKAPKVISKPVIIKQKQNVQLAKGILKTLTKPQPNIQKSKKKNVNNNNKEVLAKLRQMVGNSNKQIVETEVKLSQTEIDRIKNYVGKCWDTSIGASEVKMIIPLQISANKDGTVNSVEIVDNSLYIKNSFYRATADSARRAVLDCSPLPLPKNKEDQFKSFVFDFDPSFIYRY
jgi:outer membrane biosynthesis protein TonB